jgi:MFS family permease
MIFIVPALVGFLFGYEIGATSYAILQLMDSQGGGLSGVSFSLNGKPALTGLVVSAPSAGALLGTSIVFGIADVIGRRMELRIAGILYFVGALCEYSTVFIHTHPSSSWVAVATLMSARIVYGTGIGFAMHGAPTYLGEMCPSDIRGALVSLKEVAIVLGILCGYVIGYSFLHVYRGWAYTYLMTIVVSVTVILLSFKIPYSARWLVSHGRDEEALDALEFVWEPNQARCELQSMIQSRDSQHQRQRQQGLEEARVEGDLTTLQSISSTPDPIADHQRDNKSIFDPSRRAALTAGVGLVALQQITGQPSVLSYATPILVSAGLSSFSSVLIALFKVLATSLAVIFVEKSGRRLLLMIGCSLMFVSLVVLTTTFYGATIEGRRKTASTLDGDGDDKRLDVRNTFILAAMFVYIGGYQVSHFYL